MTIYTNTEPKPKMNIETFTAAIAEALKPEIARMIDERLSAAGVGGAKPDMAANLSQYKLPSADQWDGYNLATGFDDLPDGDTPSRASNGRKMSDLSDLYQLPD